MQHLCRSSLFFHQNKSHLSALCKSPNQHLQFDFVSRENYRWDCHKLWQDVHYKRGWMLYATLEALVLGVLLHWGHCHILDHQSHQTRSRHSTCKFQVFCLAMDCQFYRLQQHLSGHVRMWKSGGTFLQLLGVLLSLQWWSLGQCHLLLKQQYFYAFLFLSNSLILFLLLIR